TGNKYNWFISTKMCFGKRYALISNFQCYNVAVGFFYEVNGIFGFFNNLMLNHIMRTTRSTVYFARSKSNIFTYKNNFAYAESLCNTEQRTDIGLKYDIIANQCYGKCFFTENRFVVGKLLRHQLLKA